MISNRSFLEDFENYVLPKYDQLKNWEHGILHIHSVVWNTYQLALQEDVDLIPCLLAAYCHDLGRIEEEKRNFSGKDKENLLDHAILSIEPTVKALNKFGVRGEYFDLIIEAVANHSVFEYSGSNPITKVLMDADKCDAFGPFGALRVLQFNLRDKTSISSEEVHWSYGDYSSLNSLVNKTLCKINSSNESKSLARNGMNKVIEWVDQNMFHFKSTYNLFAEDMNYTSNLVKFLEQE